MRVYISGPISDVDPYDSLVAFNKAESRLLAAGCEVINPRRISCWGLTWGTYMQVAQDILYSGEVDAILLLKGWEKSKGATIEKIWAAANGIQIVYWGGKECSN